MIKSLLTGIWAVLLLSGSLYYFDGANGGNNNEMSENQKEFFGKLETIVLDTMSVAVIRKNAVRGYVILDVAFTVDAQKNKQLSVPIKYVIQNSVNNAILQDNKLNINRLDNFDADKFETLILAEINKKVGEPIVNEVLIQRIDFLTVEDVRDNKLRAN